MNSNKATTNINLYKECVGENIFFSKYESKIIIKIIYKIDRTSRSPSKWKKLKEY